MQEPLSWTPSTTRLNALLPCCAQRGPFIPQPESDLRPASGILWAAIAGGLIWVVVLCLLSHSQ